MEKIRAEKEIENKVQLNVEIKKETETAYECLLIFISNDETDKIKSIQYPEEGQEPYTINNNGNKQKIAIDYKINKGDVNKIFKVILEDGEILTSSTAYTISYYANGGEEVSEKDYGLKGASCILSGKQTEREGYTFLGWAEDKNATEPEFKSLYKQEYKYNKENDVKLYAVWKNTGELSGKDLLTVVNNTNKPGINDFFIYNEEYTTNVIIKNGNLILDGVTNVEGATLTEKVYEFGNKETDVATKTEDAKNMVILKVNGDLTINEGVTLTACKSDNGYGGPKGLLIYCTGTITNNGTIDMTARGARAEGQNVYVYENRTNNYEYIPYEGAIGGEAQISTGTMIAGKPGKNGENRKTGGGGSGAAKRYSETGGSRVSGAGTNGTSYSGGSAGGAICVRYNAQGQKGVENGGAGGKGISAYSSNYGAGGGAGNPGGYGMKSESTYSNSTFAGENGTGGLLIIYGENINNNNIIKSNGSNGGKATSNDNIASGGSSGAGSINIFYKDTIKGKENILVRGGKMNNGGAGGDGTVTIGKILNGTFVKDEN